MIDINTLLSKIEELWDTKDKTADYVLKKFDTVYYGLDSNKNLVFAMKTDAPHFPAHIQKTKKLIFGSNLQCKFIENDEPTETKLNILICNSTNVTEKIAFLRLTNTFITNNEEDKDNPNRMDELFVALSRLFSQDTHRSDVEIQGFFAELYLILYLSKYGVDIARYWQKEEKEKFDFSWSLNKKLEVKSTLKEERIHHFLHQQLATGTYDIVVTSVLLRKDSAGISVYDTIEKVRALPGIGYKTLLYIERFVKDIDEGELRERRYDETYCVNNIRFIRGNEVPKFSSPEPEGVSKAQYDSNLTFCRTLSLDEFIRWIKEE